MNKRYNRIVKVCLLTAILIQATTLAAQNTSKSNEPVRPKLNRFGIGLRISHLYDMKFTAYDRLSNGYSGEDPNGLNGKKTKFDLGYGMDIIYFVNAKLSLDACYEKGSMTGANKIDYYESKVSFLSLGLNYDLKSNYHQKPYKWVPFIRASIGEARYDSKRKFIEDDVTFNSTNGKALQVGLGTGLRYHLNENWHLNFQSEFVTTFSDAWNGYDYGSGKDQMLKTTLGLRYTFGNKPHQDRASVAITSSKLDLDKASTELQLNDSLKMLSNKLAQLQMELVSLKNDLMKDTDGDGVIDLKDECVNEKGSLANGCNSTLSQTNESTKSNGTELKSNSNALLAQSTSAMDKEQLKNILIVELNKIYFDMNSSKLNNSDRRILSSSARVLKQNPGFKIVIMGYTDKFGSEALNTKLAKDRAQAVASFLTNTGVNPKNITVLAKGSTDLIEVGNSPSANSVNRRVEILVR